MKTIKNILSLLPVTAAIALFSAGCTNDIMDRINKNPNDPKITPVNFQLPEVITSTATNTVGGDLSLYASVYMELEAGIHGQLYNAEIRRSEPTSATTYNNSWESIYTNIRRAKNIIKICDDENSTDGGPVIKGMAQVLEAINLATLTNFFGDVPYSQTAVFHASTGMPVYMQPVVDKQEELYEEIFRLLDDAEDNLGQTAGTPSSSADMLYGGNKALWIKAINGLRARYTLQLLHKSTNVDADLDAILEYVNASFESADEQMTFNDYDYNTSYNPLGAFFFSRYAIGASQSFVNLMEDTGDPRFVVWGIEKDPATWIILDENDEEVQADSWTELLYAAPNGSPVEEQLGYSPSYAYFAEWAPVHLMSYHELMFIKAEVLARKGDATAIDALEEAVLAAFDNLNYLSVDGGFETGVDYINGRLNPAWTWSYKLDEADAQAYFDNEVTPRFNANAINEVMLQKYIACMGANAEAPVAYNDYRRMKAMEEDGYLTLANPKNATQFPLRFSYGASDVNNNKNVRTLYGNGQYVYTEPVWWAGGTK